jgi:hypothetical protein
MINEIKIMDMQEVHINDSIKIWNSQYNLYCKSKEFPQYWKEDNSLMEKFLEDKIFSKAVSVAIMGERVVGFLAYDEFPFHGEKSVFCPYIYCPVPLPKFSLRNLSTSSQLSAPT